MQKIEVGRSSYFINDRKQGDLPLNTLILIALKVECILFYVRFFSSKNGKFGTFSSLSFQPKHRYLKCYESVVSVNSQALLGNFVQMYSKVFFLFLRKCQNKSACVRRFFRCNDKSKNWQENYLRLMVFVLSVHFVFLEM